jgi:hypothetical protein
VADRIVPLYLERLSDGFLAESEMLGTVRRERNVMWASLLGDLHRVVQVCCLKAQIHGWTFYFSFAFALRRSAQYFFIRSLTALRAAADIWLPRR